MNIIMPIVIIFALCLLLVMLVGGICGIAALIRLSRLTREMRDVQTHISLLHKKIDRQQALQPEDAEQTAEPAPSPRPQQQPTPQPAVTAPGQPKKQKEPKKTLLQSPLPTFTQRADKKSEPSLEMVLGTKWLNWVGIVFVIIAVAFFLKYAYDNNWVGPLGRVLIGATSGFTALLIGEWVRRKGYPILFHTLSGGGIAILYVCLFFSFQVYALIPASAAFVLSVLVTAMSVALGVIHNTHYLCLIAQIGGFLSPILLSTGENQPVRLFTYIAILNLTAMGAAFFKQWRHVNVLAFAGTALLYGSWIASHYDPSQLTIALSFATLFYLMFLVIPLLHAFVHRVAADAENVRLIAVATLAAFLNYYGLLREEYRDWLGYVVFGQGAVLLALYFAWQQRCTQDRRTALSLLIAALALVTIGIPIHFSFYAIPIAWIAQAVILSFLGTRYERETLLYSATGALGLAVYYLLSELPLHETAFIPIFNIPFGSWLVVALGCFAAAGLQQWGGLLPKSWHALPGLFAVTGIALLCLLPSLEIHEYWRARYNQLDIGWAKLNKYTYLCLLWSAILFIFLELYRRMREQFFAYFAMIAVAVGLVLVSSLFACVGQTPNGDIYTAFTSWSYLFLNLPFAAVLIFTAGIGYGAFAFHPFQPAGGKEKMQELGMGFELLASGILWAGVSVELFKHWPWQELTMYQTFVLLWAALCVVYTEIARKRWRPPALYQPLCWVFSALGIFFLIIYMDVQTTASFLFFNSHFAARLLFLAAFAYAIYQSPKQQGAKNRFHACMELLAYLFTILVLYQEVEVWSRGLESISPLHKHGIISALWSALAVGLIVFGLQTRALFRRITGFILFAMTIVKILIVDMSVVQPVYRIVSFLGCGLFLILAGYVYQRYAKAIMGDNGQEKSQ
ncbi:DUF2339 domain-containing protein [bacterium]|nr:DUF2339 domain-containing protein [bacterium]